MGREEEEEEEEEEEGERKAYQVSLGKLRMKTSENMLKTSGWGNVHLP